MPKTRKPTIEEARKMSSEELSQAFGVSQWTAYVIKTAIGRDYFSILTDNSLSYKEMGKRLGIGRSTTHTYRTALLKAGLATKKIGVKKKQ